MFNTPVVFGSIRQLYDFVFCLKHWFYYLILWILWILFILDHECACKVSTHLNRLRNIILLKLLCWCHTEPSTGFHSICQKSTLWNTANGQVKTRKLYCSLSKNKIWNIWELIKFNTQMLLEIEDSSSDSLSSWNLKFSKKIKKLILNIKIFGSNWPLKQ